MVGEIVRLLFFLSSYFYLALNHCASATFGRLLTFIIATYNRIENKGWRRPFMILFSFTCDCEYHTYIWLCVATQFVDRFEDNLMNGNGLQITRTWHSIQANK